MKAHGSPAWSRASAGLLIAALATGILSTGLLLHGAHEHRELAARMDSARKRIAALETEIATLRAERAHLARPDRIEPLARAQGLGPPTPSQFERATSSAVDRR
jgi:cell division protein FtsL